MGGVYRGIFSALVDDPDFQRLSTRARHTFLTLRICPQLGPAGIFRYYPAVLAEQTGYDLEETEKALIELEAGRWIIREGPILWLRNALRHDPSIRLSDPKHRKGVEKWVSGLPRLNIVLTFCDYYKITRPFDASSKPLRRPIPSEKEKESETETESEAQSESDLSLSHGQAEAQDSRPPSEQAHTADKAERFTIAPKIPESLKSILARQGQG